MTVKTWFDGSGSFTTARDWSPSGAPVAGDSIVFGKGNLQVANQSLLDIPITMGSFYGATLGLQNAILGNVGLTTLPAPTGEIGGNHTFDISGIVIFAGAISTNLSGGSEFADVTTINIARNSQLLNIGKIELKPQEGATLDVKGGGGSLLVNDGLIEAEDGPGVAIKIGPDVLGFGTIEFGVAAPQPGSLWSGEAEFGGSVDAQQTFEFAGAFGAPASDLLLQIDMADAFRATIANFTKTDTIELKNTKVTSDHFGGGVLTLNDGSHSVAQLHFSGSYTTRDFTTHVVGGDTLIKLV